MSASTTTTIGVEQPVSVMLSTLLSYDKMPLNKGNYHYALTALMGINGFHRMEDIEYLEMIAKYPDNIVQIKSALDFYHENIYKDWDRISEILHEKVHLKRVIQMSKDEFKQWKDHVEQEETILKTLMKMTEDEFKQWKEQADQQKCTVADKFIKMTVEDFKEMKKEAVSEQDENNSQKKQEDQKVETTETPNSDTEVNQDVLALILLELEKEMEILLSTKWNIPVWCVPRVKKV